MKLIQYLKKIYIISIISLWSIHNIINVSFTLIWLFRFWNFLISHNLPGWLLICISFPKKAKTLTSFFLVLSRFGQFKIYYNAPLEPTQLVNTRKCTHQRLFEYIPTTYLYIAVFDLSGTGSYCSHFHSRSDPIRRIRWPFNSLNNFRYAWRRNFLRFCLFIYFVDAFVLFEAYRDVYLTRSLVCLSHCAMVRHFCPCFFFVIVCVILSTLISRRRSPFIIVTHFQWECRHREREREGELVLCWFSPLLWVTSSSRRNFSSLAHFSASFFSLFPPAMTTFLIYKQLFC